MVVFALLIVELAKVRPETLCKIPIWPKKGNIIKHKNLLSHIKGKEILTFGDIEFQKNKFYHHKAPFYLKDIDGETISVSNMISSGEKNYKSIYWLLVYWS